MGFVIEHGGGALSMAELCRRHGVYPKAASARAGHASVGITPDNVRPRPAGLARRRRRWYRQLARNGAGTIAARQRSGLGCNRVANRPSARFQGPYFYAKLLILLRRRDGRVVEGGGLLNRYTVKSCIGGSNPPPSAIFLS